MAVKNLTAKTEAAVTPKPEKLVEGKTICQVGEYGGNPLFQIRHESVKAGNFKGFALNATARKVAQLVGTDDEGDSVLCEALKWAHAQGALPLDELENCYVTFQAQMEDYITAAKKEAAEAAKRLAEANKT